RTTSRRLRAPTYGAPVETVALVATLRTRPVPTDANGGMLIGSRPPIGAVPISARAAARCDTGTPLHAMRYAGTSSTCCSKYGLPSETTIGCVQRWTRLFTNCRKPCGADRSDTVDPAARYELTITTSAESASARMRQ